MRELSKGLLWDTEDHQRLGWTLRDIPKLDEHFQVIDLSVSETTHPQILGVWE